MQFQIPQFIDAEDKIVGPLTLKQFLYIAAGAGLCFLFFFLLQFTLWLMVAVVIMSVSLAAAFGKYNGQTLPVVLWHWFNYTWKPRIYIWKRESDFKEYREVEIKGETFQFPTMEMPNVKKLWQALMTTKAPIPKREKPIRLPASEKNKNEKFDMFRKMTGEREIARRIDYR